MKATWESYKSIIPGVDFAALPNGVVKRKKLQAVMGSNHYQSIIPGVDWPALPNARGCQLLALQFQLDRSQWLPAEEIERQQARLAERLYRHAILHVPYYRATYATRPSNDSRPLDRSCPGPDAPPGGTHENSSDPFVRFTVIGW